MSSGCNVDSHKTYKRLYVLFCIPDLHRYISQFMVGVSVHCVNVVLAHHRKTRGCVPQGAVLCSPADCIIGTFLHLECHSACTRFAREGRPLTLFRSITRSLHEAIAQRLAPRVHRCVLRIHMLLVDVDGCHRQSLHSVTLRFTHRAALSIQWWIKRGTPARWVAYDFMLLPNKLLEWYDTTRRQKLRTQDSLLLGLGFNITGQQCFAVRERPPTAGVWLGVSDGVVGAFHTYMTDAINGITKGITYVPAPASTPWIGYHFAAGLLYWTALE
jgi:hypothetical protein